jgi:hypothetical protein
MLTPINAGVFSMKGLKTITMFGYGKNGIFDLWHSLEDK